MVAGGSAVLSTVTAKSFQCSGDHKRIPKKIFTQFSPERAIILSKTTRLDYEKRKYADLSNQKFRVLMKKRGISYTEMKKKHLQQHMYVTAIKEILNACDIETRILSRDDYTESAVAWADVVFSAGGDGTFLIAAAKVRDDTPVIGFNTDFLGSEGHLCITRKSARPVKETIERLLKGEFSWMWRQRIRVTFLKWIEEKKDSSEAEEYMCDKSEKLRKARLFRVDSFDPEVSVLALNDVFIGESHAARVSRYEIQVDDGVVELQKSSGLTVSTGTGSTSWHYNINRISEKHVNDVLAIMRSMKIYNREDDNSVTREICRRFNEKLLFDPQSCELAYTVRDPISNSTFRPTIHQGFAKKIKIRSNCSDAHLVIDGGVSLPFNYGSEVILESFADDALRTVMLF